MKLEALPYNRKRYLIQAGEVWRAPAAQPVLDQSQTWKSKILSQLQLTADTSQVVPHSYEAKRYNEI
jgi:hypothetical protein